MPPKLLRMVSDHWGIVSGHSARSRLFTVFVLFSTHQLPTLVQFSLHSVACLVALEFRDASRSFCIISSVVPLFVCWLPKISWLRNRCWMIMNQCLYICRRGFFLFSNPPCWVCLWYADLAAWWEYSIPWQDHTDKEPTFQQNKERAWRRHAAKFNNYTMSATSPWSSIIKIKTEVDFEWERFDVNSKCSELRDSPQKNCE